VYFQNVGGNYEHVMSGEWFSGLVLREAVCLFA